MDQQPNATEPPTIEQLAAQLETMRQQLQELRDREAIRDCLARYCRGIDRFDTELALSAYHLDALDDHCLFVDGPGPLVEWANEEHRKHSIVHQHIITTHNCELDGDVAHTETYWSAVNMLKDGLQAVMVGGRYLDRFEKRGGEWKIAAHKVLYEWRLGRTYSEAAQEAMRLHAAGSRDRNDPSYARPLIIDPDRVGCRVQPF